MYWMSKMSFLVFSLKYMKSDLGWDILEILLELYLSND